MDGTPITQLRGGSGGLPQQFQGNDGGYQMQQQMQPQMQQQMQPQMQQMQQMQHEQGQNNPVHMNGEQPINVQHEDEDIIENEDVGDIIEDIHQQENRTMGSRPELNKIGGDTLNMIIEHIKEPLTIILLYLLINQKQVDNIIFKYIRGLISEDGCVNVKGLIIKAVLMAALYYLVKTLLF